jgi:hypothetical protein
MNRTELFVVLAQIWLNMHGCGLEYLVGAKVSDDAINNSALHESRSTRKLCKVTLKLYKKNQCATHNNHYAESHDRKLKRVVWYSVAYPC